MRSLILILSFLLACPGMAQVKTITSEDLLKDIDAYRDGIVEHDIDPFTQISKQQFFEETEKIKKDTGHLNIDELIIAMRTLNARLGDEHSYISGFKEGRVIPVMCYSFEEGIFIVRTDAANSRYLYFRLIAINHVPIAQVVQQIAATLPNKNTGTVVKDAPALLSRIRILHGLRIISNVDSVPVTLIDKNNDTVNTIFIPQEGRDITFVKERHAHATLRHSNKGNYWYHYDPAGNFIYFNYASCDEDESYPFDKFINDFFKVVSQKNPAKIIIDLRDNGGGRRAMLQPFIHELSKSALNKQGHVFVLIGRETFSAAMNNVFDIARAVTITTVGESTSGSINHLGQVKSFKLPNSGLNVTYSTNHIINDPKATGPLQPNAAIPERFADFINDKDAALNYAIAQP